MSREKELAKNTVILFIGKFCTQFVSFLLLPLYTSLLSTSEYGTIDLIQTYIMLLIPIATLRIDSAAFRYLIECRNDEDRKSIIITNLMRILSFLNILFLVVAIIIARFINIEYIELLIINVIITSFSNVLLQTARGLGDNLGYSIASSCTAIFTIIFNVIFLVVFKWGVSSLLISSAIANVICILILVIKDKIIKYIDISKKNKELRKELLKYSIPMVPTGLSWWVLNASDRTLISYFIGTSGNGVYAISNKFPNVFSNIYSIFNLSWSETAALHINDKDKDEFFTTTINRTFNLFASLALCIVAGLPIVFKLLIVDSGYDDAYAYIPILMLANVFNIIQGFCAGIYIAKKQSRKCANSTILSAAINIIINMMFIRQWGIYAAAISTLVAYMVVAIYRYADIQKYVKMKLYNKTVLNTSIVFAIAIFFYYKNNIITNIINILFVGTYSILVNKDIIKSGLKMIKSKTKKIGSEQND